MRQFIKYYFSNNLMEYVKLLVIFVIGIVVSIIVINKSSDTQQIEIRNFIDAKIETVKTSEYSDKSVVLVNSLKKNVSEFSNGICSFEISTGDLKYKCIEKSQ